MFDPQPHLIKLPRKVKDRATGHYTTVYDGTGCEFCKRA